MAQTFLNLAQGVTGNLNLATNVTGTLPNANFSGGKVSQVINGTTTTEVVTASSSFQDTGLTASITPSATSSKILIICNIAGVGKNGDAFTTLKALRDSTDILANFENRGGDDSETGGNKVGSCSFTYLDSPSTTSATTYKVQVKSNGNSYAQTGDSNPHSTITLMEILA
jgi:hypothetical protein